MSSFHQQPFSPPFHSRLPRAYLCPALLRWDFKAIAQYSLPLSFFGSSSHSHSPPFGTFPCLPHPSKDSTPGSIAAARRSQFISPKQADSFPLRITSLTAFLPQAPQKQLTHIHLPSSSIRIHLPPNSTSSSRSIHSPLGNQIHSLPRH